MKHDNDINNNFHSICGQSLLNLSAEAPSPSPGSASHKNCVSMGNLTATTESLPGGSYTVASITISVTLVTMHFNPKLSGVLFFLRTHQCHETFQQKKSTYLVFDTWDDRRNGFRAYKMDKLPLFSVHHRNGQERNSQVHLYAIPRELSTSREIARLWLSLIVLCRDRTPCLLS